MSITSRTGIATARHCTISAIAALAVAVLGVAAAPQATASPAPASAENAYLNQLRDMGLNVTGGGAQGALFLGYVACKMDKLGGSLNANGRVFLSDAQANGLCDYVSVGDSSAAENQKKKQQIKQVLDLGLANSDPVWLTNEEWLLAP